MISFKSFKITYNDWKVGFVSKNICLNCLLNPSWALTVANAEQPEKVSSLIIISGDKNVISMSDEQLAKALLPIDFTDSGIIISVKPEQPKKVSSSILAREVGIFIFLSEEQLAKAALPINLSDWGIEILVNLLQPENELEPIDSTDDGIIISHK